MSMTSHFKFGVVVAALILLAGCVTQVRTKTMPATPYDVYLLVGQSNMAGRGEVGQIDKTPHPRVFALSKEGEWVQAVDPIHFDKPAIIGVGPGLSFGKAIAAHDKDRKIGLVPAAVGGSGIATWQPGGWHKSTQTHPYDDALARARIALKSGQLKGIIWHQGESDSQPKKVLTYALSLRTVIANFRRDLNAPDVPFIVGGLGTFLAEKRPESINITALLQDAPNQSPNTGFISALGLVHKGDAVHFSASSARELGDRYAQKYLQMRAAEQTPEEMVQ